MYKRALELDPKNAINLGNYALFLTNIRKDYDAAEMMYKRALKIDPRHANNLANYAIFLGNVRHDYDTAEAMYRRAVEAEPHAANTLGAYAVFLDNARKDEDAARAMYKRAVAADPNNPDNKANWAGFLLATGELDGLAVLHQTIDFLHNNPYPTAELECAFYLFAHGTPLERPDALRTARRLLKAGVRSPNWNFSRNIERALLNGHPDVDWLGKLASVINDEAKPEMLKGWPAWEKAAV
jgi:tetratricopeptide (TPR) repeat protein